MARRAWLRAWVGAVPIGVGNGILREATYGRRVGEGAAHQISGLIAIAAFGFYFAALQRRWPIRTQREAAQIGMVWVAYTIAFEFGFGRLVAKQPWEELRADYNVAEGRTWPLVVAWIGVGPSIARAVVSPRGGQDRSAC